jgi:hypothetical protein
MRSLSGGRLSEKEAVAPIVVVAKLFQRILQDVSPGQQDIEAVYWDYLGALVNMILNVLDSISNVTLEAWSSFRSCAKRLPEQVSPNTPGG